MGPAVSTRGQERCVQRPWGNGGGGGPYQVRRLGWRSLLSLEEKQAGVQAWHGGSEGAAVTWRLWGTAVTWRLWGTAVALGVQPCHGEALGVQLGVGLLLHHWQRERGAAWARLGRPE